MLKELIQLNNELTRKSLNIEDYWLGPHMAFPESGKQILIRFKNGYGVSIVQFACPSFIPLGRLYGSYGVNEGKYELAVIKYDISSETIHQPQIRNFRLCYDTEITDDVIGYLSEEEVIEYVEKVSKLCSHQNKPSADSK